MDLDDGSYGINMYGETVGRHVGSLIDAGSALSTFPSSLSGLQTPLQLTEWLLIVVFLMALSVGVVYVALLFWTLWKWRSHEPLAHTKAPGPRPLPAAKRD